MTRSLKKGPYVDKNLIKKVIALEALGKRTVIKTYARNSDISPDFVGHTFGVHNGRKFIPVLITESMVGHKMGEFSHTRIFRSHPNK